MAVQPAGSQLVVIGASAGGVEALSTLVATLPPTFPAPLVVAQHISPLRASHLEEILARRSTLPVQTVTNQVPLQPGVVYVVPADRHVAITNHDLTLRMDSTGGPKPSIDLLFKTAAEVFGEGLIAVVLTGMGTDGAAGARVVKEAGGTVVIQNPQTASFPSMPRALAPTTVDVVADLEVIGALLYDLLTGAYTPTQPGDDRILRSFLAQVRDRSGIDFSSYKAPTIERRLQRRMAAVGTHQLTDYLGYLDTHPEEYDRLVNSFLIKVTEFFRDQDLFTYLASTILPELVTHARTHDYELRIWSAGCATGEEAYSLAILLCEVLGNDLDRFGIRIFGTDLDGEAIAFARRGIYPTTSLTGMSPDMRTRYFIRVDDAYEVNKFVRSLVVFGQHDLGERAPFPRIDLCLCRNVLIYFTPELQKRALQLFAFSLRDGGLLVLGKAETANPLQECFTQVQPSLKVFRRQGDRGLIPLLPTRDTDAPSFIRNVPRVLSPAARELDRLRQEAQAAQAAQIRAEDLLVHLPVGVAVIDRHYDIQMINSAARRLLGIYRPAIGEDIVHLVQTIPPSRLRAGIDAALRGETFSTMEDIPTDHILPGTTKYLHITCSPHRHEDDAGPVNSVLIMVLDSTVTVIQRLEREREAANTRQVTATAAAQIEAEVARLREAVDSLTSTNRELLMANEALTSTNMTLRTANDGVLINSEEIQAAAEEVETLNEELQASNEELVTLNEEMQATVEELNTTNDDLQARSAEMQQQAIILEEQRKVSESQRQRLREIFAQTPALLALTRGPLHSFELASGAFLQGTNRSEGELAGLTVRDLWPETVATCLVERMDTVFATGMPASVNEVRVRTVQNPQTGVEEAFWTFELKPMRAINGAIEGVLLAAIDLTDQVVARWRMEELMSEASAAQARLSAILTNMVDAVLVVDLTGHPVISNAAYDRLFNTQSSLDLEDDEGQPLPFASTPAQWAARGESFTMQFTSRMEDGNRRWFEANGYPITTPTPGGGVEHWGVVAIRDITDRSLRRMREEFIASVSHELQTPLTAIRASLGMLETSASDRLNRDEREMLEGAREHVERLRVHIDDLLAANQIGAGILTLDLAPCDVRTAITSAASIVQPLLVQKEQTLEVDVPAPLPVLGDMRRLEQVFVNLLANAQRHTPSGTHVVVEGHATPDLVHVVVRDDGPGIPSDRLEDIFRRFYRLNPSASGSGLGLAITRTIVELHRGRIWAESAPGSGAAFHIDLPQARSREGES